MVDIDGEVYAPSHAVSHPFWTRYLSVFADVTVVARVTIATERPAGWQRVDGPAVSVLPIPLFSTAPWTWGRGFRSIGRLARRLRRPGTACLLRVPCPVSTLLWIAALASRRPFFCEVVGDPYDSLAPGASTIGWSRALFRIAWARTMRAQVAGAAGAAYVTERALQRRYPPRPAAATASYTSARITADELRPQLPEPTSDGLVRMVSIGSLEHRYKGAHVLLESLVELRQEAPNLRLVWVGGGCELAPMEALARDLGVDHIVQFLGHVGDKWRIHAVLDSSDVYVQASLQEGTPRGLLEAMGRGLPCVATDVGGCSEVLPDRFVARPDDAADLAARIRPLLSSPELRSTAGRMNLVEVRERFLDDRLQRRREAFYAELARTVDA